MRLSVLSESGRPHGWVISAVTMTFLAGLIVWGCQVKDVADRLTQMEGLLYLLVAAGCTGMTLKGLVTAWGNRKGAA